jgi:cation-transporting ATPase E
VLAVLSRPYTWWRVVLVALSATAYAVIFSLPLAQQKFMLDPSDIALSASALAIGVLGAGIVEALWWVQGAVSGERRRVWR